MNDRAVWQMLGAPVDNDPPLLRTDRGWAVAGKGECLTGEGALKLGLGKWLGLCQTERVLLAEATELRAVRSLEDPTLQTGLAKTLCWARACSNLPNSVLAWLGASLEGGSSTYPESILPILASSRKGTPHAASPPEVNAPTTPNTLPSLALTLSSSQPHGMEVGLGSLSLGSSS